MLPRLAFWRRDGGVSPDLDAVRYVVLDTELTSLDDKSNRLLSIGAIAMDGARIRLGEQFYRVVNPGVEVPAQGVLVHRLRPADVAQGEPPARALDELLEFIGEAVLVGHFFGIDLRILRKELGVAGRRLDQRAMCTARVERWMLRRKAVCEDTAERLEHLDLMSVAKAYGLSCEQAHHALDDAFLTARLWQKMMSGLKPMGVRTLADLLRIGRV
jgi:DNA polymerase III epsilon subunit-like protein